MFNKSEFGKRVKTQRLAAGYATQDALAVASGVSVQAISAYEKGDRAPSGEMVAALAIALKCTTDYLLLLDDAPTHAESDMVKATHLTSSAVNRLKGFAEKTSDLDCPNPHASLVSFLITCPQFEALVVAFSVVTRFLVAENSLDDASKSLDEFDRLFLYGDVDAKKSINRFVLYQQALKSRIKDIAGRIYVEFVASVRHQIERDMKGSTDGQHREA